MKTYKRELKCGSHFLLNPNTHKEKLVACDIGGGNVRITHKGREIANRTVKEDENGRYFTHDRIRYNLKEG